jgi:phosphopantothenoylcysteine decarboxylase/phosphopantothenate--cysteine ligase
MAAAVADYRPAERSVRKIKKDGRDALELRLVPNPDILSELARLAPGAVRVGFAAETERVLEHGERKLLAKSVDFLVVNDVSRSDIGFGADDNEVVVLRRGRAPLELAKRSKRRLAAVLVDLLRDEIASRRDEVASRRDEVASRRDEQVPAAKGDLP